MGSNPAEPRPSYFGANPDRAPEPDRDGFQGRPPARRIYDEGPAGFGGPPERSKERPHSTFQQTRIEPRQAAKEEFYGWDAEPAKSSRQGGWGASKPPSRGEPELSGWGNERETQRSRDAGLTERRGTQEEWGSKPSSRGRQEEIGGWGNSRDSGRVEDPPGRLPDESTFAGRPAAWEEASSWGSKPSAQPGGGDGRGKHTPALVQS